MHSHSQPNDEDRNQYDPLHCGLVFTSTEFSSYSRVLAMSIFAACKLSWRYLGLYIPDPRKDTCHGCSKSFA